MTLHGKECLFPYYTHAGDCPLEILLSYSKPESDNLTRKQRGRIAMAYFQWQFSLFHRLKALWRFLILVMMQAPTYLSEAVIPDAFFQEHMIAALILLNSVRLSAGTSRASRKSKDWYCWFLSTLPNCSLSTCFCVLPSTKCRCRASHEVYSLLVLYGS